MIKRSEKDSMIAGVCGGIAEEFNIDPLWIRGGLVLLTLGSYGFPGVLVYIIAWALIPEE